jgi:hypothetical protein
LKRICAATAILLGAAVLHAIAPETLRPSRAVPPEIAGRFREPRDFQQSATGQYFVFDRRDHTVYGLDRELASVWQIVHIGAEPGRIIRPTAFSVAPNGTFVVADAPQGRDRLQVFTPAGFRVAGFSLEERTRPRITFEGSVLSGIGSLQYTGVSVLLSRPEHGALVTEYSTAGEPTRSFGGLRQTGHEADRDVHLALNSGFPLVDPTGGFYFVFQAGPPVFRKYDAAGRLLFERQIQGQEIEPIVAKLPTSWARQDDELPVVPPTIRAAAVDRAGRLWIALADPYLYVFDRDGDKIRALQLRGAGVVSPSSLSFGVRSQLLVTPGLLEFIVE